LQCADIKLNNLKQERAALEKAEVEKSSRAKKRAADKAADKAEKTILPANMPIHKEQTPDPKTLAEKSIPLNWSWAAYGSYNRPFWTKEYPSKNGHYWIWIEKSNVDPQLIHVSEGGVFLYHRLESETAWFLGPMKTPPSPEKVLNNLNKTVTK